MEKRKMWENFEANHFSHTAKKNECGLFCFPLGERYGRLQLSNV